MKGCIDHCNVSTISVEAHAYVGSIAGSAALLTNSMNGGLVFLNENEKISDKNKKYQPKSTDIFLIRNDSFS